MGDGEMRPGYDPAELGPGERGKYYDRTTGPAARSAAARAAAVPDADLRARYEKLLAAVCAIGTVAGGRCGSQVVPPADRAVWQRVYDLACEGSGFDFEVKT